MKLQLIAVLFFAGCTEDPELTKAENELKALSTNEEALASRGATCSTDFRSCMVTLGPNDRQACRGVLRDCLEARTEEGNALARNPDGSAMRSCADTLNVCMAAGSETEACVDLHRSCLCDAFADVFDAWCTKVMKRCATDASAQCGRLFERCSEPMRLHGGLCRTA